MQTKILERYVCEMQFHEKVKIAERISIGERSYIIDSVAACNIDAVVVQFNLPSIIRDMMCLPKKHLKESYGASP